jgi:predicted ribosome quality control (RQC) complex YloA/Tae2 family protein
LSKGKPKVMRYVLPGDWELLVGATDLANDYLSTTLAQPDDWWFHADGVPGSHVVLRAKPETEPGRDILRQAAAVAAYHSTARGAGTARVHCARARHVSKPRGAKAGTVRVSQGSVLKVYPGIGFAVKVPRSKDSG